MKAATHELELDRFLRQVTEGGLRGREEGIAALLRQPVERLVPFLLERVARHDFAVRNAALEVLERAGAAVLPVLVAHEPTMANELRMFVAPVLAAYGRRPETVELLLSWLEIDDPNLRATVCEALGRLRAQEAVAPLGRLARSDPWVAGSALMALAKIGDPSTRTVFVDALADPDLQLFALPAAARLADVELWPAIARLLCETPDLIPIFLEHGARLLELVGASGFGGRLPDAIARHHWREAALEGLGSPFIRAAAARVLTYLEVTEAVPRLVELYLEGADEEAVVEALQRIPGGRTAVAQRLRNVEGDEAAWRLLRVLLADPGVPVEAELLYWASSHPNVNLRLEVLEYLGTASEPGATVAEILAGLLADPEESVRRAVLELLRRRWYDEAWVRAVAEALAPEDLSADVLEVLAGAPSRSLQRVVARLVERSRRGGPDWCDLGLGLTTEGRVREVQRVLAEAEPAAATLEQVERVAAVETAEALAWLERVVREARDAGVRYVAAEAVAAHPAAGEAQLETLASSRDPGVLAVAYAWIASRPDPRYVRLLRGAPSRPDIELRRDLLRAWAAVEPETARRLVERWRSEELPLHFQAEVARVCGSVGEEVVDPELRERIGGER